MDMVCKSTRELIVEIKRYMMLNDVSQKELTLQMKKSQQAVSKYFQKDSNPTCDVVFAICDALNVDVDVNLIPRE
jgi:transcriptional regulator with XRE-family HTH domain